MSKIQRALISVSDKTGLTDFAKELAAMGVEILSTGGTAKALRDAGLKVMDVSEYTGFPEMMDGRVKTLHPKVHGGLLFLRGHAEHEAAAAQHGIKPIDLVVVNLYPFEKTVARPGVRLHEAIENIDIGGPSMLRSAAKNHASVTVIVDPADYPAVLKDMKEHGGETCASFRRKLAIKVYQTTGAYDAAIAGYLHGVRCAEKGEFAWPDRFAVTGLKAQELRYGENPHQRAALYGPFHDSFEQLHGKELSYNNILDISAAAGLIAEFSSEPPTCAILKHTNPCGVGQGASLREAWDKAFETDKQAPFGGIIVVNRALDPGIAEAIAEIFSEVIIAPDFAADALAVLQKKKNLRLMRMKQNPAAIPGADFKSVPGGFLVQDRDTKMVPASEIKIVTRRQPTDAELKAMLFGWRVVKHVKSNAIVYAGADRTLGIGAGQMSRVDSSRIAVWKAGEAKLPLKGSAVASDAFFPFPDALLAAADAGATAAIQPGGSVRDQDVIKAADERGMAMVFTGMRHFRH
jgi:phosphoribosylaminoimidazolecarboxamide formyltransferase/IMP cyclohydrolase